MNTLGYLCILKLYVNYIMLQEELAVNVVIDWYILFKIKCFFTMLFDFHTTRGSHYIALLIIVDEYLTKLKILDDI